MLNPNCSEMVMKLEDVSTVKEAIELLRSEGFIVEKINRYVDFSKDKSVEIMDKDNPNLPDFAHGAHLSIYKGDYDAGNGIYIVGHQHCQHQLYATIYRLESIFGGDFEGYDGGYDFEDCYNNWLDKGKPDVMTSNVELRERASKILLDKTEYGELSKMFRRNRSWETRKNALMEYCRKKIYAERQKYIEPEDEASKKITGDKERYLQAMNTSAIELMKVLYVCIENKNIRNLILEEHKNEI